MRVLPLLLIGLLSLGARAEVTPEMQRAMRAATFEVVLKKPERDPLTYEKPLPLDLLPYIERHDAYRSIGTAFSLGRNTYVTAAHVLAAGIDSQYGAPALRGANGTVYAIDRILKYSAHEDMVVFSLLDDPAPQGLPVNRQPKIDEPVFAVGNALGEGIVIRDGLFTSLTAEEQDGLWKWIRFSAAASPGNSGGPLLDGNGSVIGIVLRKSANENLNYSLPIGRVLDASDSAAHFNQRGLSTLPFMRGTRTYAYKDEFRLPLVWRDFAAAYDAVIQRHGDEARAELMKAYAASAFASGAGAESILFSLDNNSYDPRLIGQQADDAWAAIAPDYEVRDLPGDGYVSVASLDGVSLLRLHRANLAADDEFYGNSKSFMDVALKGLDIAREVGSDDVRVTSLGAAVSDTLYTDHFGRTWQQRVWALPYRDAYVVGMLLPTPDGYSAILQIAPSSRRHDAEELLRLLADQLNVSYVGTLAQWQAHLRRRSLLSQPLRAIKLEQSPEWSLRTEKFETRVPERAFRLDERSKLGISMGFMREGSQLVCAIAGAWWFRDDQGKSAFGLWRQPRPPRSAKLELRNGFTDIWERRTPYDGLVTRAAPDIFETNTILDVPGRQPEKISSDVVYGVTVHLDGRDALQDIQELLRLFVADARVLERAVGEDANPAVANAPEYAQVPLVFDSSSARAIAGGASDAAVGRDIRGRLMSEDFREYLEDAPVGGAAQNLRGDWDKRIRTLADYWSLVPGLVHNRDLWTEFLKRNKLPGDTPHNTQVADAQSRLLAALAANAPSANWAALAQVLLTGYIEERVDLAKSLSGQDPPTYYPRKSRCPKAAIARSGTERPAIGALKRSPDEFYPSEVRRAQIEGAVILAVRVDAAGCAVGAGIVASSGSELLDQAALDYIDTAEFVPAERQGRAVEGIYKTLVRFQSAD